MKEILNNKKTRLRLFENGIKMDESLPKHKEYNEYCDLTFDVLTEKLGQEIIEQDFIKEHIKL